MVRSGQILRFGSGQYVRVVNVHLKDVLVEDLRSAGRMYLTHRELEDWSVCSWWRGLFFRVVFWPGREWADR